LLAPLPPHPHPLDAVTSRIAHRLEFSNWKRRLRRISRPSWRPKPQRSSQCTWSRPASRAAGPCALAR
jgi:hypothetical protein